METHTAAQTTAATRRAPVGSGRLNPLEKLKAMILLGGSVRQNGLPDAIGQSVLDLPIQQDLTVLGHWVNQAGEAAESLGLAELPVRLVIDQKAREPGLVSLGDRVALSVEHDPFDFRGTAGLLRDLTRDYDGQEWVIVATAGQLLLEPLVELVRELVATDGDVGVIAHADGSPTGLMLVRCDTLESIPDVGFVDMKEQALPNIARTRPVRVIERETASALPLNNRAGYIRAVRLFHLYCAGQNVASDPLSEDWSSTFSLIEDSESVDDPAQVHDSVVLRGGRVASGAVLVRSIVGSDGVVEANQTAVDTIVTKQASDRRRNGRS